MVVYPAPQRSDFATYVELARDLLETHRYGSPHVGLAFWPPGYPILLYLHFLIFGVHSWVPAICNYILFLCTLFAVDRIATRIVGAHAGRVGTLLLLFWPEFFTSGWLASKELLVASLLPLSLLAYFNSAADRPRKAQVAWLILAGMMLGFAGLGQPSMVLFPIVFLICDWLRKENFIWSTARLACTVSAILLVILPWTVRNHRVLGEWILVSSNGGSVFYRANNELATGGFTQSGSYEFERLDEVSKSRLGYKMAGDWIRRNPAQFLVLALRKQVLFLGDDSTGVYETLKRGIGMSGLEYAAWKGISNAYWLAIWIFILAGIAVHWNAPVSSSGEVSALMLGVLYLYSIHSVFESNDKYHLPLIGLFGVLASVSSSSGPSKNQRRGATT